MRLAKYSGIRWSTNDQSDHADNLTDSTIYRVNSSSAELPFIQLLMYVISKSNTRDECAGLTFEGFGWCFSAAGCLWNEHALSKHLYIKACIVKGHLGVFLQLLGQVGSRSGGHCVGPVAAILRNLQLFHKTHGPGDKIISCVTSCSWYGHTVATCIKALKNGVCMSHLSTLSELEEGSLAAACKWTCLSWFLFSLAAAAMGQPDRLTGDTHPKVSIKWKKNRQSFNKQIIERTCLIGTL